MADPWANVPQANQVGPARRAVSVTCSDSANLTDISRGLSVKTAGDYPIILADDSSSVTMYLTAGIVHPLAVKRVYSTGAASTSGVVAYY